MAKNPSRKVELPWALRGLHESTTLSQNWKMTDKLFYFTPFSKAFTLDMAFRGIKIYGATGSGKTSGFVQLIGTSYLDHGFGGLVLCAKGANDELNNWSSMCASVERKKSLIHFGPQNRENNFCLNPLEFIRQLTPHANEVQMNIVKLLRLIGSQMGGVRSTTGDSFWDGVTDQYLTHLVSLTTSLHNELTFENLKTTFDLIQNNPKGLFSRIRDDAEIESARNFFEIEFPRLNEKTSSVIIAGVSSLLFKFTEGLLKKLFGSVGNIDPRWTFSGAVIIVNVPVNEYSEIGRVSNVIWKYCFQKACQSRKELRGVMRPVFLWADEAQEFIHPDDAKFQAMARSSKCATVYITQNIAGLRLGLGSGSAAADAITALESNLLTTIFNQNANEETNRYASTAIGTKKEKVTSRTSKGVFSTEMSENTSFKEVPIFRSADFVDLKIGGHAHRKVIEAIVFIPGAKRFFDWKKLSFKDSEKVRIIQGNFAWLRKNAVDKYDVDFKSHFAEILTRKTKTKKILIVDDDEELKAKLKGIFENSNSEVVTAGNGLEAIDFLLKDQDFDLVVIDIDMPEMTGLEFLTEVRRRGIVCPEIYMMSGGGDENLKAALELGAIKAFSKYKIEELIEAVERI